MVDLFALSFPPTKVVVTHEHWIRRKVSFFMFINIPLKLEMTWENFG